MKRLDQQYFSHLEQRRDGAFLYEAYETRFPGSTLVLFPRDDPTRPIAALAFVPLTALEVSSTCDVHSAVAPRPVAPQRFGNTRCFQAMFDKGNREMAFVITNLIDGDNVRHNSTVKIDLFRTLPPVQNQTDYPEHGINRVNELHPSQSFAIKGDQTREYMSMVLRNLRSRDGTAMTVDGVEQAYQRGEQTDENYLYVSVVASHSETIALLRNSTWCATDYFVRKLHSAPPTYDLLEDDYLLEEHTMSMGDADLYPASERGSALRAKGCVLSASNDMSRLAMRENKCARFADARDIGASQAASIGVGNRQIVQVGNETGIFYVHATPGEKMILCFSVWHDMRCVATLTRHEAQQEATLLIGDALSAEKKILIAKLQPFVSDACCVCLEANPSIVLLRCAHQCLCSGCVVILGSKRCPVCRATISQTIDADEWRSIM